MSEVIRLSEDDLRELFALFSSPTEEEVAMIYSPQHRLFFRNVDLTEEYSLTEGRGDFAEDAWRAVTYFLDRHGYRVTKDRPGDTAV
jgi:hypothetical protein